MHTRLVAVLPLSLQSYMNAFHVVPQSALSASLLQKGVFQLLDVTIQIPTQVKKDMSQGLLAFSGAASADEQPPLPYWSATSSCHILASHSPLGVQPGLPGIPLSRAAWTQSKAAGRESEPAGIASFLAPVELLRCFSKQQQWKQPSASLFSRPGSHLGQDSARQGCRSLNASPQTSPALMMATMQEPRQCNSLAVSGKPA